MKRIKEIMSNKKTHNFLFFALAAIGSGISGGDRIFIEFARRWSMQSNVIIYTTQDGLKMCKRQNLLGNKLSIQTVGKRIFLKNYFIGYFYRIYQGVKLGLTLKIKENTYVYSASDFWMDSIPAFFLKLRFKKVKWIAAWYQTAPNPLVGYRLGKRDKSYRFSASLHWMSQFFIKPLIKIFADLVLVNNYEEKKQFLSLDRQKRVGVVLGAINFTDIKKWIKGHVKKNKIYDAVYQGRFHFQKGVIELINIWRIVVNKRPNAMLAMIGDGPLMENVRKRISNLGLNNNIKLFGYIFDGPLKYDIFSRSRLVVHPAFYDSGGMAAAEAMAFGLPCVGFDLKSYESYYPKGMLKVEIGNMSNFANSILRLLQNEEYNQKVGQEAIRMIESSWSWNKRSEEIFELITKDE